MPVWGPIVAAVAPFILEKMFGGDDDERYEQASQSAQGMSKLELAEAQRISELNRLMQSVYGKRFASAGSDVDALNLKKIFGGQYAGLAGEMLPGIWQDDALQGLMGMTGNIGGGTINAEASRGFLDTQANTQAAASSVEAIVNNLLDLADKDTGGEQQAPIAQTVPTPGVGELAGQPTGTNTLSQGY